MIHPRVAQHIIEDKAGNRFIENDWYPRPLPSNIDLAEMSYPDTSYSFTSFFSSRPSGFKMGYASGNYGHGIFTTGTNGQITIGDFVVLQCTRLVCNLRIDIADHCMFSWGSTVTDSWVSPNDTPASRKKLLEECAHSKHRHIEFDKPQPVFIEENVWVGFEAVILPGVRIGRGAIIGSKSVIFEDVPPYAVVVGNPGRVVRILEPTDLNIEKEKLLEEYLHQR